MFPLILICTVLIPRPTTQDVDLQPLAAQAGRVVEAMEYLGAPISPADKRAIQNASRSADSARVRSLMTADNASPLIDSTARNSCSSTAL